MNDSLPDQAWAGIQSVFSSYPKVRRVVLFGSRAMGNYRKASDVDLALEGDDIALADLLSMLSRIRELNLPVEVDLIIRAKITNPDLERHIEEVGQEIYLKNY